MGGLRFVAASVVLNMWKSSGLRIGAVRFVAVAASDPRIGASRFVGVAASAVCTKQ